MFFLKNQIIILLSNFSIKLFIDFIFSSFEQKLNKMFKSDSVVNSKGSKSPVYSSDSFIPLSEPSTSTGQRSHEPVVSFRGFRNADRRPPKKPQISLKRSFESTNSSSPSTSSLVNLFRTPRIESTYYERNIEATRVSSSYMQSLNISEEDRFLYNDPIPFLYEEVRPSTSSESIGSSNVGDIDLISASVKLDRKIVQNVVNLIEDQCTIPFIVRYRQSAISGIDTERVRKINTIYNEIKEARERAKDVEQVLKKQERINPRLKLALSRCKTVFEVEHLFRLCRNPSEDSEKYKNLGLSDSAVAILEGKRLDPNHFVNRFAFGIIFDRILFRVQIKTDLYSGLDTSEKIQEGLVCAILLITNQN